MAEHGGPARGKRQGPFVLVNGSRCGDGMALREEDVTTGRGRNETPPPRTLPRRQVSRSVVRYRRPVIRHQRVVVTPTPTGRVSLIFQPAAASPPPPAESRGTGPWTTRTVGARRNTDSDR